MNPFLLALLGVNSLLLLRKLAENEALLRENARLRDQLRRYGAPKQA